jgi:hypothetical protein
MTPAQGGPWRKRNVVALVALAACATGAPPAPPGPQAAPEGLRVQLHFGGDADLDLYVTDPLLETVYYANSPTRRGGRLDADLRCDDAAPRTETVTFRAPPAGRYRVGVDFQHRCRVTVARVPYRVVVEAEGLREETTGEIEFGRFEALVLEFDLPAGRGRRDGAPPF